MRKCHAIRIDELAVQRPRRPWNLLSRLMVPDAPEAVRRLTELTGSAAVAR